MAMEIVECLGGVLSGDLLKNNRSTRMRIYEFRDVVYSVVDNEP